MKVIGADFGGTTIKLGLVSASTGVGGEGEPAGGGGGVWVLRSVRLPAEPTAGLAPHLEPVATAALGLLGDEGIDPADCNGLALALPCPVDAARRRALSSPRGKYQDAPDVDLAAWAEERLGWPLRVEMDSHAALLGEWFFGAGRGCDDLVGVTLGTGIGTSVILRGRPLRGLRHQAGTLGGHFVVAAEDGRPCICPGRGCLETETANWALPQVLRSRPGFAASALAAEPVLDHESLFRLAAAGDAFARAERERILRLWGAGCVNLAHAYDPARIILGGGVMASAGAILPALQDHLRQHAWCATGNYPEIVAAEHPEEAGLLGLAALYVREGAYQIL